MRQVILNLAESRIREVANAGMGRSDVLAFWFGESDEVTPDVIRQAAIASLQKGETFYSQNLGLPELRHAVAEYMSALHGPIWLDRLAITSGGVKFSPALKVCFCWNIFGDCVENNVCESRVSFNAHRLRINDYDRVCFDYKSGLITER